MMEQKKEKSMIKIERIINVPKMDTWNAWADPRKFAQWYGPKGVSVRIEQFEFKTGGFWKFIMIGHDKTERSTDGRFVEIEHLKKIVYEFNFEMMKKINPESPPTVHVTVLFEEKSKKTHLTLLIDEVMGMPEAWESALDKLEAFLEKRI